MNKVTYETGGQVFIQILKPIWRRMTEQVKRRILERIEDQVGKQIKEQTEKQIRIQIKRRAWELSEELIDE